jgi:ATP:ADP antiporter, AAA family
MPSPRRLFDDFCRRLGLEPHEGRLLVLMGLLVGTLICAYTIAKVVRDALFIAEFGALFLPYAYIGVALASVAFVWLESVVAGRFTRVGASRFNQYAAIALGALAAILLPISRHWTVAWIYLWTGSQAMMLLPQFWGLALDLWDSRRARHVFPVLAGCGLIGGLAGGAFAAWSTPLVERVGLMWVIVALLAMAHLLTRIIERYRPRQPGPAEAKSMASRWDIIRKSRYIKIFAAVLALSVIVGTLVDFQFKYYIQHIYSSPGALTGFFGKFYVVLNAAALLFQFGAATWLMQRFGLGAATQLQPTSIVLLSAWVVLSPGWWAITTLRGVQGVVSQSLGKASTEIYYAAVRPKERRLIKPAIDTLVERWSDAAVGVMLILVLHALHVGITAIAIGTAILAGVWLLFALLLNREFSAAFANALSSRWIDPESAPESMRTPAGRKALVAALQSADEPNLVLALQLSQSTRDPQVARAVRDCLRHSSPNVRVAAVQAMEAIKLRDHENVIEGFLGQSHEGLRRSAVGYMLSLGPHPAEFARRLLEGDDPTLRQYLVDALFDRPYAAAGVLTLPWIDARLASGSRTDVLLAARALGAVAGRMPATRLRGLLAMPDVEIQREALRSATRRPARELLDVLLECLPVPDLSYQAREALAAVGDPAVPGLRQLLGGGRGGRLQDLATRTLSRIASPPAIRALMTVVRSADVRLRYLGLQGLARMRVRTGAPVLTRSETNRLFLRELRGFRDAQERALALEAHAAPEIRLLGESYRESAEMALERALQALACWYEPKPLPGVFERLRPSSHEAAAPALEYLAQVLPRGVFRPVRDIFEAIPAGEPDGATGKDPVAEGIRHAWESGDEWLRACAVHASRTVVGFDAGLFVASDHDGAVVRAVLAAPSRRRPGAAELGEEREDMLTPVERVMILKGADLLKEVGPRRLLELADVAREVEISKGETIYQEEDPADALYLVVEGRVRIVTGDHASEVGPGEAFGTWALVDESGRGHRAECIEDGRALALYRDAFYDLAAGDLTLLQEVVRALARRLRALVSDQPLEARVEGEGIEKPEALVQAEAAARESAAPSPDAPSATAGAALAAAALGQKPLPDSAAQEAQLPPEQAREDIVPTHAPETDEPQVP